MSRPQRIQRRRTKGWRMPDGACYVGRPTKWGAPFRVFGRNEYLYSNASHRRSILSPWVIWDHDQDIIHNPATPQMAVDHYRRWVLHKFDGDARVIPCPFTLKELRLELRGHDLCDWCALDAPCHADVLLALANPEYNYA